MKIYSISIDTAIENGINSSTIENTPIEERLNRFKDYIETFHSLNDFFNLLNGDFIDTENFFWFPA